MATAKHPREYEKREPAEIERDIAQTRRAIDSTVEELGQRLAPGQLVDDARTYVKETAVRGVNSVWTRMSDNAVPLGLIGGGVLWMMASRRSRHDGGAYEGFEGYEGYEGYETGSGLRERASDIASSGAERAREMASSGAERAREVAVRVRERGQELRERGAEIGGQVSEQARQAGEQARETLARARQGFDTMRDEQPLLLGIAALAAGAIVGGLIPSTRREDELVGEVRDQVVGAAAEKGAEKVEQVRQAAERTAQEARSQSQPQQGQPDEKQSQQSRTQEQAGAGSCAPTEGGI